MKKLPRLLQSDNAATKEDKENVVNSAKRKAALLDKDFAKKTSSKKKVNRKGSSSRKYAEGSDSVKRQEKSEFDPILDSIDALTKVVGALVREVKTLNIGSKSKKEKAKRSENLLAGISYKMSLLLASNRMLYKLMSNNIDLAKRAKTEQSEEESAQSKIKSSLKKDPTKERKEKDKTKSSFFGTILGGIASLLTSMFPGLSKSTKLLMKGLSVLTDGVKFVGKILFSVAKTIMSVVVKAGKLFGVGISKTVTKIAEKLGIKSTTKVVEKEGVKVAEKATAKDAAKATAKVAEKAGAKIFGKEAAETATKVGEKTIFKSLVKKIPIIGALVGAGFAINRLMEGDKTGAALELASGVASTIPGIGTATSFAIDAGLAARDLSSVGQQTAKETTKVASVVAQKTKTVADRMNRNVAENVKLAAEKTQKPIVIQTAAATPIPVMNQTKVSMPAFNGVRNDDPVLLKTQYMSVKTV